VSIDLQHGQGENSPHFNHILNSDDIDDWGEQMNENFSNDTEVKTRKGIVDKFNQQDLFPIEFKEVE